MVLLTPDLLQQAHIPRSSRPTTCITLSLYLYPYPSRPWLLFHLVFEECTSWLSPRQPSSPQLSPPPLPPPSPPPSAPDEPVVVEETVGACSSCSNPGPAYRPTPRAELARAELVRAELAVTSRLRHGCVRAQMDPRILALHSPWGTTLPPWVRERFCSLLPRGARNSLLAFKLATAQLRVNLRGFLLAEARPKHHSRLLAHGWSAQERVHRHPPPPPYPTRRHLLTLLLLLADGPCGGCLPVRLRKPAPR